MSSCSSSVATAGTYCLPACVFPSCVGATSVPWLVIEHLDDSVGKWNCSEYSQIAQFLPQPSKLLITNFSSSQLASAVSLSSSSSSSNSPPALSHAKIFEKSVLDLFDEKDENAAAKRKEYGMQQWKREEVCYLDMHVDKDLEPEEAQKFKCILVGGILGDHPPRDRAKHIRERGGFTCRRLGKRQMTTDTAAIVAFLIVAHQHPLHSLPFIDDPDISTGEFDVTCMPFRYLVAPNSESLKALEQAKAKGKKPQKRKLTPFIPHGVLEVMKEDVEINDPLAKNSVEDLFMQMHSQRTEKENEAHEETEEHYSKLIEKFAGTVAIKADGTKSNLPLDAFEDLFADEQQIEAESFGISGPQEQEDEEQEEERKEEQKATHESK